MRNGIGGAATMLTLLLVALVTTTCRSSEPAVTGAIAPAPAAITFTERGASTTIAATITELADAAERAFQDMNMSLVDRDDVEDRSVLIGLDGDWTIVVDIGRQPDEVLTTATVVVGRHGTDFSRSRADQVLRTILARADRRI